jgi:hypothetical protein
VAAQVRDAPAQSQAQAGGTASIRGRVVRLDTGEPLSGVNVFLNGTSATGIVRDLPTATTDSRGQYELKGLPAARYTLTASKGMFVSLQYGQRGPYDPGRSIEIADGQVQEAVDLALPRGAAIAGRVVDAADEPITNAVVQVLRLRYVRGQQELDSSGGRYYDLTDDRGEYRVYGLPPGTYFLSASVPGRDVPEGIRSPLGAGLRSFYPAASSPSDAQPVTLALGQQLTGVSLVFTPGRAAAISGTVRTADGRSVSGSITLAQRMPFSAGGGMSMMSKPLRPDGSYVFPDLPPGAYTLRARPRPENDDIAIEHVVLDGSDLVVPLMLGPGGTLRGRFVFDGAAPQASLRPSRTLMSVMTEDLSQVEERGPSTTRDDWTFEITGLIGRYRLRPPSIDGWTVKSIRVRDADVTDTAFAFAAGVVVEDVEVVLTNRPTELTASVRDAQGKAVADATVVVLADDPAKWTPDTRFVAVVRPDQRGQFRHRGLPPARYVAVALEYLEPGEETRSDLLARLRELGRPFTLEDGEATTLELSLSKMP